MQDTYTTLKLHDQSAVKTVWRGGLLLQRPREPHLVYWRAA